MTVMQNIEAERARFGYTVKQLAEKLEIDYSTYYVWKKSDNMPLKAFIKCTQIFGCSADYLTRGVV